MAGRIHRKERAQELAQMQAQDEAEAQEVQSCGAAVNLFASLEDQETALISGGHTVPKQLTDMTHQANNQVHAVCGF
ncbi:MAG: hypothetical protein ACRD2E_09545 [Terriglobales bacterium]